MKKLSRTKLWVIMALCMLVLFVGAAAFFFNNETKLDGQKSAVTVAMAADNNYTYPTVVSITSLMTNAKNTTHYDIHIMVPHDFTEENKQKLLNLPKKFENRCQINLIDMQNSYESANVAGHIRRR